MSLFLRVSLYYLAWGLVAAVLLTLFPDLFDRIFGDEPIPAAARDLLGPFPGVDQMRGSPLSLAVSMGAALVLMVPVSWVYMGVRGNEGWVKSNVQTILLLPIAVAGIVIIVQNSLALAFSLAGIVAVTRFRITLKDTADALYIFTAIGVGLAAGIGALAIAAVLSVVFNYSNLVLSAFDYGDDRGLRDRRKEKKKRKQRAEESDAEDD